MICPACSRDNDARRRYCGKCGHNFRPCCRRCAFANDGGDRFCGGCGANLVASEGVHLKTAAPPPVVRTADAETAATQPLAVVMLRSVPAPVAAPAPAPPAIEEFAMPSGDELAGLFTATVMPSNDRALPASGVSQDDVDRLFGVSP